MLYGSIGGDIVGSRFEFRRGVPVPSDFELFTDKGHFTDDTVLTLAIAECILSQEPPEKLLAKYAQKYPKAGYGGNFSRWATGVTMYKPYNSYGNGSAMRISAVAYAAQTIEECLEDAKLVSEVTHNHPEGIKGGQATAVAIFMARNGHSKEEIKDFLESKFGYNLGRKYEDIRKNYSFDVSCQGSVPESIICFLESDSWEDSVRKAVLMGGDTDTMACIAGGIAEAFYGPLPKETRDKIRKYLPEELLDVLDRFEKKYGDKK